MEMTIAFFYKIAIVSCIIRKFDFMARIIVKFGGTSVADPARIEKAAQKVLAEVKRGNQVGVAPEAQIINSIMFPNGVCNLSDWISWFNWLALQPEINIVNISAGELSLPAGYFELFNSLIDDLIAVGLLPICAVGNEGFNRSRTPGNCKGSLSVGAINNKNKVAYFSGNTTITITNDSQSYNVPYVVAPGESVYSSVLGGGYEAWNGTSMATPIVSGVAALVLEKYNKNISVLNLLDEILTNCKDLGLDEERQGKGLVQVPKALYEP